MNYYDLDPIEQRQLSTRRLFQYIRDYVQPYHPFLRRLYREAGVDCGKLRTIDDVRRLPIIDKEHLQSDPLKFVLRPAMPGTENSDGYPTAPLRKGRLFLYAFQAAVNFPADRSHWVRRPTFGEKIRRRGLLEWQPIHSHVSTGSTGKPSPVFFSLYDMRGPVAEMSSLVLRAKKPPPDVIPFDWNDRAMNVFPGAPHIAFFAPVLAKVFAGISSFETFGGNVIPTDRQIEIFANGQFNSLTAVPSYLVHWLRLALTLLEKDQIPPLKHFRRAVLGAEPVSDALRDQIRSLALRAGAHPKFRIYQTLGMTEMKWTFLECNENSGIHLNPKYFFWELLDPETREPAKAGDPGVLVFSHIGWRGTVLIRYWTGDLIRGGVRWERCAMCGYTFPKAYPPVCRADKDFTKIKGTRVDLSLLIETVRATPGVRQLQVVLEREDERDEFSRDRLSIHISIDRGADSQKVEEELRSRIKHYTEVSADRVIVEPDEQALEWRLFARNGIKAEYLVERRRPANEG